MADYVIFIGVLASLLWLSKVVYFNSQNKKSNRSFALMLFWLSLWTVSNFFAGETTSVPILDVLFKLDFATATLFAYYVLLFCLEFPTRSFPNVSNSWFFYPMAVLCALSFTNLIVKDVSPAPGLQPTFTIGPLGPVYAALVGTYVLSGVILIFVKFRRATGITRIQAFYVLLGLGIFCVAAVVINLVLAWLFPISLTTSRLGIYLMLPLAAFPAYGIVRYRLMDIRLLIQTTGRYLMSASLPALVISVVVAVFTNDIKWSLLSFLTALSLPFLQGRIAQWIALARIKSGMVGKTAIPKLSSMSDRIKESGHRISDLAETVVQVVMDEIPTTAAAMYVLDHDSSQFHLESQAGRRALPAVCGPLISHLEKEKQILVRMEAEQFMPKDAFMLINKAFSELKAEVCAPLFVLGRLSGLLVLGAKSNKRPYFLNEIDELGTLASETSTALRYVLAVSRSAADTKKWAHSLNQYLKPLSQGFDILADHDPAIETNPNRQLIYDRMKRPIKKLGDFLRYLTHHSRIIDDVLRDKYQRVPVNLNDVLQMSVSSYKLSLEKKGIQLKNNIRQNGKRFHGHQQDLIVVFEAILSNAIRYVPQNGWIQIDGKQRENDFEIQIGNNGPVVPEQHLEDIFNEGFQVKNGGEGSGGLGLANVKRIVETHGGRVWAENISPNAGVHFCIRLPN